MNSSSVEGKENTTGFSGDGRIDRIILAIILATLVAVPLLVLGHKFLPPDDALRYGAKAVSGKSWQEIMVMRPEVTIDHNPGWNWMLRQLHLGTSWGPRTLVQFSVALMFLAAMIPPLVGFKRRETWLLALAICLVAFPYFAERSFTGRPFMLTIGITLCLLSLWSGDGQLTITRKLLIFTTLLFALSTWIHGSWYLLPFIPGVFFAAGQIKKAGAMAACLAVGVLIGACLTFEPVAWLRQSFAIPFMALDQKIHARALVGEFDPFTKSWHALLLAAAVIALRHHWKLPLPEFHKDPILIMAVLGALGGARVYRFWLDWGLPAFALWMARQIQEMAILKVPSRSWSRIPLAATAAFVLLIVAGWDRSGRWSNYGSFEAIDARRPDHAGWLPDQGGILYAVNLSVFYQTFFQNPHGNWRYALGFEPSFMLPENFVVYNQLWATLNARQAIMPWINKMTPADRLVLLGGPQVTPGFPQLEWRYAVTNTWVGRLPRE